MRRRDVYVRLRAWDPAELLYATTHDDAALTS
jgi:hypothetical protein